MTKSDLDNLRRIADIADCIIARYERPAAPMPPDAAPLPDDGKCPKCGRGYDLINIGRELFRCSKCDPLPAPLPDDVRDALARLRERGVTVASIPCNASIWISRDGRVIDGDVLRPPRDNDCALLTSHFEGDPAALVAAVNAPAENGG